ncbi:MAG: hypothetical protein O2871_02125 [bacterium]|nr:hypothetical protein [bacterium]
MKYKFIFSLICISVIAISIKTVNAQSEYLSLKRTYLSNFSIYQDQRGAYETAKSKYESFGTLSAQTLAAGAAKSFLNAGATSTLNYLDIINYQVRNFKNFDSKQQDMIFKLISDEQVYYKNLLNKTATITALSDLNNISTEVDLYYKATTAPKIKLILLFIETEKTIDIQNGANDISNDISRLAEDYSQTKKSTINVWYQQTLSTLTKSQKNIELATSNLEQILDSFINTDKKKDYDDKSSIGKTQKAIDDSQELLKTVINNIDEIVIQVNN